MVLTPSTAIMIPPGTPSFCSVEFDVQVLAGSADSTPSQVEQVGGYTAAARDAECDNGLASSGSQAASIPLCPPCGPGTSCPAQLCNQTTGVCEPAGDQDGDGEADATDRCPGTSPGEPVDDAGCSHAQFCAGFDLDRRACKRADWKNDEPLMKGSQADCRVDRDTGRCVPASSS